MLLMLLMSGVGNKLVMTSNGPSVVDAVTIACGDSFAHAIGCVDEFCGLCTSSEATGFASDSQLALDEIGFLSLDPTGALL